MLAASFADREEGNLNLHDKGDLFFLKFLSIQDLQVSTTAPRKFGSYFFVTSLRTLNVALLGALSMYMVAQLVKALHYEPESRGFHSALAAQKGSVTAAFLRTWNLTDRAENPPHVGGIPRKLVYIYQYALDMTYVPSIHADESLRKMRQRIYQALRAIHSASERVELMRILRKHPDTNWRRLWLDLHSAWVSDAQKSM